MFIFIMVSSKKGKQRNAFHCQIHTVLTHTHRHTRARARSLAYINVHTYVVPLEQEIGKAPCFGKFPGQVIPVT